MKKYAIIVRETLSRTVIVEADDLQDAIGKVDSAVEYGNIILDCEDFNGREIEPSTRWKNGEVSDGENVDYYFHLKNK